MARRTRQPVEELRAEIEEGGELHPQLARILAAAEQTSESNRTLEVKLAKASSSAAGLRERVGDERARADRLEQHAADLSERLLEAQAEHHRIKPLETEVARLEQARVHLEERLKAVTDERDVANETSECASVRADEIEQRLAATHAELEDLRRLQERTVGENRTLSALSRQQAKELIELRKRVGELMASRWRKLGQRIGVAMVMPWEREGRR